MPQIRPQDDSRVVGLSARYFQTLLVLRRYYLNMVLLLRIIFCIFGWPPNATVSTGRRRLLFLASAEGYILVSLRMALKPAPSMHTIAMVLNASETSSGQTCLDPAAMLQPKIPPLAMGATTLEIPASVWPKL